MTVNLKAFVNFNVALILTNLDRGGMGWKVVQVVTM